MKVSKEQVSPSRVALTIEVSPEEARPFIDRAAKKISEEVKIPGFRPGHVPYDILQKHVSEAVIYEEAFQAIAQDTYPRAVEQEKLQVVGRASMEVQKIAPGNPIVYKATVPLLPVVELGNYKKFKAQRRPVTVDAAELEKTLNDLRQIRASEKLVNRPAAMGDKVLINMEVRREGAVIEGGQAQKMPLMLGEKQFIPGFEDQLMGMGKDQEKMFTLKFPDNYFKKDLAGRPADFKVKLVDVYEVKQPELTDQFATELQFKDLAYLKGSIEKNIRQELEQKERDRFEAEILSELVEKSRIAELPEELVDEEMDRMMDELRHQIEDKNGLKFDDYLKHLKKSPEDLKKSFRDRAVMRLKTALVARKVSEVEKIDVSAAELDAELKKMREQFAKVPDMAKQMDHPGYRRYLANQMTHRKVVERLESFTK